MNAANCRRSRERRPASRICTYPSGGNLKVGCRIRASTGVVVLFEIRLEGRSAIGVLWLVTEGSSGAGHEVVVVFVDPALSLLHAPEDKGDTTEKKSTSNTSNYTTDDLLVGITDATAVVA